jgi:hypothetical protein
MWVYVISIMEAWNDSTKGTGKTQWVTSKHMKKVCALISTYGFVSNKTIEELMALFFSKEIHLRFWPYYEIEQD